MPGAINRVGFDNWYPGFQDFTGIFRNSISFFTETALYNYATPHFYTVRRISQRIFRPSIRRFFTAVHGRRMVALGRRGALHGRRFDVGAGYCREISRAVALQQISGRPRQHRRASRKIRRIAYVIPTEQRDLPEAGTLVQKLMINGIEVHQATQPFTANGRKYSAGSWVILMDQPFAGLVKEFFEPQKYPELAWRRRAHQVRMTSPVGRCPCKWAWTRMLCCSRFLPEQRAT